jgi:hypothetical protein
MHSNRQRSRSVSPSRNSRLAHSGSVPSDLEEFQDLKEELGATKQLAQQCQQTMFKHSLGNLRMLAKELDKDDWQFPSASGQINK